MKVKYVLSESELITIIKESFNAGEVWGITHTSWAEIPQDEKINRVNIYVQKVISKL